MKLSFGISPLSLLTLYQFMPLIELEKCAMIVLHSQYFVNLYAFMSFNVCFVMQVLKNFKKPILDELSQNRANIEYQIRSRDQELNLGKILNKIHGRYQFLKILVSFKGFGLFLEERSKEEVLGTLRKILDFSILEAKNQQAPL